jgi:MFS superfamily sulfate permease-like transporter
LVIFRWDAPLFFANAEYFRSRVLDAVAASPTPVRRVVVAASAVQYQHCQRWSFRCKRCRDVYQVAPLLPFNGQAMFAGGERDGFTGWRSAQAGDQQYECEKGHEPSEYHFHGAHIP